MVNNSLQQQANNSKVTVIHTDTGDISLSSKIVKEYLVSGGGDVTDQEVKLFIALCSAQKLNPLIREAYIIKFGSLPATTVVSKDVYQKRANKNPNYKGKKAGIIVLDKDNNIVYRQGTFYLKEVEKLVGGWCEVYREHTDIPERIEVSMEEYVGKKKDGSVNGQWLGKPATMIRKVAVAQALREAFTEDYQGMYIPEEMGESSEDLPSNVIDAEETAKQIEEQSSTPVIDPNDAFATAPEGNEPVFDPMG